MNPFWSADSKKPGADPLAISSWEERNRSRLPNCLKCLLEEHNGGTIGRYCHDWELFAVDAIRRVDRAWLEEMQRDEGIIGTWTETLSASGLPESADLFAFANSGNVFSFFYARPDGKVDCYGLHIWEDGSLSDRGDFEAWCETNWPTKLSEIPTVDWSDISNGEILADLRCLSNGWVQLHQVLVRKGGELWLYVHELRIRQGEFEWESISKTLVPEPLNARQCSIERQGRGIWELSLSVADSGSIRSYETTRTQQNGGWFREPDEHGRGRCSIESSDQTQLLNLRLRLLGTKGEEQASRRDQREHKLWGGLTDLATEMQQLIEEKSLSQAPPEEGATGTGDSNALKEMLEKMGATLMPGLLKKMSRIAANADRELERLSAPTSETK